jgi:hypothetical protein
VPILVSGASFQVGEQTPGYRLTCGAAFPIKITYPLIGSMDSGVSLQTTDISGSPPVFCTGPLPAAGVSIQGSLVIPMVVLPFGVDPLPKTCVGIQFVLQPVVQLAPLVPVGKR